MLKKGCQGLQVVVKDVEKSVVSNDQVVVVKEFSEVFSEELHRLPLHKEIKFCIDVVASVAPISIPSYCMALGKLKKLRNQLPELLAKGLIRPSTSPWGALVLFIKKKDETM